MLPIVICRHYDVEWLDSRTCYCHECGKRGHWTDAGYSIWMRAEPWQGRPHIARDRPNDPDRQRVA